MVALLVIYLQSPINPILRRNKCDKPDKLLPISHLAVSNDLLVNWRFRINSVENSFLCYVYGAKNIALPANACQRYASYRRQLQRGKIYWSSAKRCACFTVSRRKAMSAALKREMNRMQYSRMIDRRSNANVDKFSMRQRGETKANQWMLREKDYFVYFIGLERDTAFTQHSTFRVYNPVARFAGEEDDGTSTAISGRSEEVSSKSPPVLLNRYIEWGLTPFALFFSSL